MIVSQLHPSFSSGPAHDLPGIFLSAMEKNFQPHGAGRSPAINSSHQPSHDEVVVQHFFRSKYPSFKDDIHNPMVTPQASVSECTSTCRWYSNIQLRASQVKSRAHSAQSQQSRIFHTHSDHPFEFGLPVTLPPSFPVSEICITFQVQCVVAFFDDFLNGRR